MSTCNGSYIRTLVTLYLQACEDKIRMNEPLFNKTLYAVSCCLLSPHRFNIHEATIISSGYLFCVLVLYRINAPTSTCISDLSSFIQSKSALLTYVVIFLGSLGNELVVTLKENWV